MKWIVLVSVFPSVESCHATLELSLPLEYPSSCMVPSAVLRKLASHVGLPASLYGFPS